jgi:hypothetical protein
MKPIVIFTAIILLPLLSGAQTLKTFADTSILFSAKYPANWVNKIKEDKRVFFTSPSDDENVNIGVTKNPLFGTSVKVTSIYPAILEDLKSFFIELNEESHRFFKWNNTDACEIIYSGHYKQDETLNIRIIQWFCFYKTRLYTVTFTAEAAKNNHNAEALAIMKSIVFTK